MRSISKVWGLVLLGLVLLAIQERSSYARILGVNPTGTSADLWCNGGRIRGNTTILATELCQDSSGNWIPTTNNNQSLGTSSLQWSDVEAANINSAGGNLSLNTSQGNSVTQGTVGTVASLGNGNAAGPSAFKVVGSLVFPASQIGSNGIANQGITVSTTIPVLSTYETLTSSATNSGLITITATPSISTLTVVGSATGLNVIPGGTYLILGSTAPTNGGGIILQDNGTLSGSKLHLGASTRQIGPDKVLTLIWESQSGFWEEVSYANNN